MPFNLALIKEHPYTTGAIVLVGGIAVFYLASSGGSSAPTAGAGNSDYLAASSAIGQANAAAAIQSNAQQAAIQQATIAASVQDKQTDASVSINQTNTLAALVATLSGNKTSSDINQTNADAATLQQLNQETSNQNIFSIQEQGLLAQIQEAGLEKANDNATGLAGLIAQLSSQTTIAGKVIDSATGLATQQENDFQQNVQSTLPLVGKKYNSALDANNANAEILAILSGGNPGVAQAGVYSSASTANSGNAATASILNSISKLGASIGAGLFA